MKAENQNTEWKETWRDEYLKWLWLCKYKGWIFVHWQE